jgi:hypothetical protein
MSTMTAPARLAGPRRTVRVKGRGAPRPLPRTPRPVTDLPSVAPVRLTRRGRLVLTVAALAAAAGILGVAQPQALALGPGHAPATQQVTVRPGETLWVIAERVAPDADPRDTVARIEAMNDLPSSAVPAGSVLRVPAAG